MGSGSEEGSYLRLIDSCITQLNAQGPSETCRKSKEEEEEDLAGRLEDREAAVERGVGACQCLGFRV